jgi:hypothetical protein
MCPDKPATPLISTVSAHGVLPAGTLTARFRRIRAAEYALDRGDDPLARVGPVGVLHAAFSPLMVDPTTAGAYAVQAQPGQTTNGRTYWTTVNPPPYGCPPAVETSR